MNENRAATFPKYRFEGCSINNSRQIARDFCTSWVEAKHILESLWRREILKRLGSTFKETPRKYIILISAVCLYSPALLNLDFMCCRQRVWGHFFPEISCVVILMMPWATAERYCSLAAERNLLEYWTVGTHRCMKLHLSQLCGFVRFAIWLVIIYLEDGLFPGDKLY